MTATPPSKLSKLLYAVAAIAVFGLVGPPVGGIVAWALMGARAAQSPYPFLAGSYAEGLVLALGTGLLVVGAAWIAGRTSWLVAVGAAVLANVLFFAATALPDPSVDLAVAGARSARALLPPSLVAALVCWILTRRLMQPLQS